MCLRLELVRTVRTVIHGDWFVKIFSVEKKGCVNMAMVWRIILKSDLPDSPNYGNYCLRRNVAAMGWILDKHNPDIASGKIKIS